VPSYDGKYFVAEPLFRKTFGEKMSREQNSNGDAVNKAATRLHHMPWRHLTMCPCSGRQIRHHLLIADLLVWIVIILTIVWVLNLA
jgi:hypothetical protein